MRLADEFVTIRIRVELIVILIDGAVPYLLYGFSLACALAAPHWAFLLPLFEAFAGDLAALDGERSGFTLD